LTDAPAPPARNGNGKTIVLHLVSHASGEMVEMIARNAVAQLDEVTVERHLWKMVRSLSLLPDILAAIAGRRGFVFHSIAATDIRNALEEGCV
jgi:[pyruvate, water dikinase]-phosphate phosphotransferase / [pyruvate, water dikinase] kinase